MYLERLSNIKLRIYLDTPPIEREQCLSIDDVRLLAVGGGHEPVKPLTLVALGGRHYDVRSIALEFTATELLILIESYGGVDRWYKFNEKDYKKTWWIERSE